MSGDSKFYFPVYSDLIDPKHREVMKEALWIFLWLIDKTTNEFVDIDGEFGIQGDVIGVVLGKVERGVPSKVRAQPVTFEMISDATGFSEKQAERHLKKLITNGYVVVLNRVPRGQMLGVRKSKKRAKEKRGIEAQLEISDEQKIKQSISKIIGGEQVSDDLLQRIIAYTEKEMSAEVILDVLHIAAVGAATNPLQYALTMLNNAAADGVKTLNDFHAHRVKFKGNFKLRLELEKEEQASETGMKEALERYNQTKDPKEKNRYASYYYNYESRLKSIREQLQKMEVSR